MTVQLENITPDDIDFAIVGKNEIDASIVVCFWVTGYTPTVRYNISLPINTDDNSIPKGEELQALIKAHRPLEQLTMEISRYKTSVMIDYAEIDQLMAAGAKRIPKQL